MHDLRLPRGRRLSLDPFALMGVVNVTPDSFYEGSRRRGVDEALAAALSMEAAGATIIDVGGESTRPGSAYVDEAEELARVLPVVEAIRSSSDIAISVDTRKAAVFAAALEAGADMLNDVSSLVADPAMAPLAAERAVPVVLMHMKGEPKTMQEAPFYEDCLHEVAEFLDEAAARALAAGVHKDLILLDPGIGFGKRLEDNLALLAGLDELSSLGYPLIIGVSRKAFIGALTGKPAGERLAGSLGAVAAAYIGGARLFRVHDVAETRDLLLVLSACLGGGASGGSVSGASGRGAA